MLLIWLGRTVISLWSAPDMVSFQSALIDIRLLAQRHAVCASMALTSKLIRRQR